MFQHKVTIRKRRPEDCLHESDDDCTHIVEVIHGVDGPADRRYLASNEEDAIAAAHGITIGIEIARSAVAKPVCTFEVEE